MEFASEGKPRGTSPFDRQVKIEGWKQTQIEESACLLLGAGACGTGVALGLARLGIGKMIIIDYDVVDVTNLNRQILFSPDDVGKSKVECVKSHLEKDHMINPKMEVEIYNFDVLSNWQKVIELARQCNVVFNMIDVGEYYDAAVGSLCMKLELPIIQGGNYCQQFQVDVLIPGEACISCSADTYDPSVLAKLVPSKILDLESIEFIPRDKNPIAQSNYFLATLTTSTMISRFVTRLIINDPEVPFQPRLIMNANSMEAFTFPIERSLKCPFCIDVGQERTFVQLGPDCIQRGLVGKLIQKLEQRGFKMLAVQMTQPKEDKWQRIEKDENLIKYYTSGPVCHMVWEGQDVITTVHKIIEEFRQNYGLNMSIAISSEDQEQATKWISFWFMPDQVHLWNSHSKKWIYE